jgi:hypothetical protein
VGLTCVLVDLLRRRALNASYFRVDPAQIKLGEMPEFVPDRVAGELEALAQVEPRSVFDPSLASDLKASLARHPWVKEVSATHRMLPNRVTVDLKLRVPSALVDVGAWRLTVDALGFVLEDHASLAPDGLIRIRGDKKSIPRIPRLGKPFRCQAVEDGLAVVSDLRRSSGHVFFRHLSVAVVDVTNVGSKQGSEIVLELSNGTLVEWGSAPTGALGPIELPSTKKLDNLLLVHDRHPGFHGVARVHAASEDPFVTLIP